MTKPQLSYSGISVQDMPSSFGSIRGVNSSIAMFERIKAREVLSYADYKRTFDSHTDISEGSVQAYIRQLFQNGGRGEFNARITRLAQINLITFNKRTHLQYINELTHMLHESYRPLLEKGLRCIATNQKPEITLKRLNEGKALLGFVGKELSATITLAKESPNLNCEHYRKDDVSYFTQFAVKKKYQGRGLGQDILRLVEGQAKADGACELALDTPEHAHHLIEFYTKMGYAFVQYFNRESANYRSVVLSKKLF